MDTIPQVGSPKSIAVNPNTNRIYVSISNNTIYVIDGTTDKGYSDIPVRYISNNIAVNPNTNRIYGDIGGHANRIFVINGSSSTLMTTFVSGNVSYSPVSLSVDPFMNGTIRSKCRIRYSLCDKWHSRHDVPDPSRKISCQYSR